MKLDSDLKKILTKNRIIGFLMLFVFCFCILIILPQKVLAAYDPGLVLTDNDLSAKNTMTENDIQGFLVARGSALASITVPTARDVTYWNGSSQLTSFEGTWIGPIGSEVNSEGWRASKVIYQVAQWYGVNPQVILAIIQKESIFITRQDGLAAATVGNDDYASYTWLMGYAFTEDTRNPNKNVCGTSTNHNATGSCAGLAMQIDWAAGSLPSWAQGANNHSTNPGYGYSCNAGAWSDYYWTNNAFRLCDGDWVTARSGATAALYRYTPHTGLTGGYTGNKGFYSIYANWFSSGGNLRLSSSLTLSNYLPAIGETMTSSYTLENYGSLPITLDKVVVAGRDANGNIVDYPPHLNVTLAGSGAAGDSLIFTDSRNFASEGVHSVWISYYYQGAWVTVIPDGGKTNYMSFAVHRPNLTVTGFTFNPASPTVGQEVSATYIVKNNETKDIQVAVLSVGNRLTTQYSQAVDYGGYTGITIPAGRTVTYTVKRIFTTPGLYVATVLAKTGSYWTELKWGNGVSSRSYYWVGAFVDSVRAVVSLTLENPNPAIGETVTSSFRIRNKSATPINLERVAVVGRNASWAEKDFPVQYNVGLAASGDASGNDFYTPPLLRTVFSEIGTYRYWITYLYMGKWYDVKPDTAQIVSVPAVTHFPNLTVTGFTFNPASPTVGQEVSATYIVKNNETKDIQVAVLSVGNRLTTQYSQAVDYGGYTGITIPAGRTVTYTVKRIFTTPGLYVATVLAKTGSYWTELKWGNGVSSRSYYWVQ